MSERHRPVLVVTNLLDETADVVIRVLNARAVPVARLDPGVDIREGGVLAAALGPAGMQGHICTATRRIDLDGVRSVYWRRPTAYAPPAGLQGAAGGWTVHQFRWGMDGVLAALPRCLYLNHPLRNRTAEYKPSQLAVANQVGLSTPPTLITTDPQAAKEFCTAQRDGAIYKTLWTSPYPDAEGRARTVWVSVVDPDDITDAVSVCPHLFQAKVVKEFDVRLTAVGDKLFAVRIDIDGSHLDWRKDYSQLRYATVPVPADVVGGIGAYLREFGLEYGAFDFAVTSGGHWTFLECNPNGQWAWFPEDIREPIAQALADQLQKGLS
ncbi:ATP-grasp ribosomal peptide maturase [Streptomyces sp. NPDC005727]|uniref:ATP-grasp ribosomal peptide maturase n=1 Tax=Streptomyces sp. NPDC005727 TaxID=3157053 RepID=UPI0033DBCB3E